MKKLILLTCIFLSFNELLAIKNDFKPGYVVLASGDTLEGFVETKTWRISPNKVTFTSIAIKNDTITYGLKDIKGFSSNGFIFTKRKVKIDIQPNEITELTQSNTSAARSADAPVFKEDTVLLQVLVGGKANLYLYNEPSGRSHYYLESDVSEIQELLNTMFEKTKIGDGGVSKNYIGYAQEYKMQLLTSLIGCKTITYKECDIDFKESDLKKLILTFNKCVEPNKTIYASVKEEWVVKPYLGAGLAIASMKFKSGAEYYNYLIDADFTKSTSFTANFGLSFIIPKYDKRLSIYSELAYINYRFESQVPQSIGLATYDLVIDYTQIGLNLGMAYNLSKNKVSPYLKAGISMLYSFNYTMEGTSSKFAPYNFWPAPRKFQMGLNFGTGIAFGKFAIEYQLLLATGFSLNLELKNTPVTNSILVKYTF